MAGKSVSNEYSAKHLSVLEGLDAVRKRPGMYIGSTDSRGLIHCLWEIIDNSVDEALAGFASQITVTLHSDGSVEVVDNGRGIPVDIEQKTKLTGVELVLTKLHAGGKFGTGSYHASGGLHGVGASVVNALSLRLDVEVLRESKSHSMSFKRGVPGVFEGASSESKFAKKSGLNSKKAKSRDTGTRIRYWFDPQIFEKTATLDWQLITARARQTAFLVPGLTIILIDNRQKESVRETFHFTGGVGEFCEYLNAASALTPTIRLQGKERFVETIQMLDDKGQLRAKEVERELYVDIALIWNTGYESNVHSFVNIIETPKGGTHLTGFERSLVKVANEQLKATKTLKPSEENVSKDDVLEGLTAVVSVRLPEPQFEGQTKEILGTPAALKIVSSVVAEEFSQWITKPPRGEKMAAKTLLDKFANAMRARVSARQQRDVQRRKNALENSTLPTKLRDCRLDDNEKTELFIVEGESALGTAKDARNSEFQAILPIRGKILNVQKASLADMLNNAECASIIQVIGAGSGRTFDLEQVRYGKIILMTDADVDGAHIRCLLLTLIHRYMKPLIDAGRVFAAVPPLHRIELSGKSEVIYTYSDGEMRATLEKLQKAGKKWKEPIQRYKGLGEMDARQLKETTVHPETRQLRRITMKDTLQAEQIFELLMGNEVAPRKDFIVQGSTSIDRNRIDV